MHIALPVGRVRVANKSMPKGVFYEMVSCGLSGVNGAAL